jgi:hypothetical protein
VILAVTVRGALERKYGPSGYQNIRSALDSFTTTVGGLVVAIDDPVDMTAIGMPFLGAVDPGSILLTVRSLIRTISSRQISLLIAGGDDIVPFWRLTNPVGDRSVDPDTVVVTDNPYGTTGDTLDEYLAPSLSVGRLYDHGDGGADGFVQVISDAGAYGAARMGRSGSAVVINSDWSQCGHDAAATLPDPVDWHITPGYVMNTGTQSDTDRRILYFNLHGFSEQAEWKGYEPVRGQYVTAVTPEAFDRRFVSGATVFAENCYGAQTLGRTAENSCALRLVKEGAAFIGATGLAFGSHLLPRMSLQDSDYLARSFFARHCRYGQNLGSALRDARRDYLNDTGTPLSDPYKQKTLLQFVLLGDPEWN